MVLMEPTGSSNTAAACVAKRGVLENECVCSGWSALGGGV